MLKLVRIILAPLVLIYSVIVRIRNYFFDKGFFKSHKVDAKIISIGNLTVGGSGKTPTVIHVAEMLKKAGVKVGVLSRGYRRSSKGYKFVSDGKNILVSVSEGGDEIYLVSDECSVPTAVAERRVEGTRRFLRDVKLDTVILDDAFQHRWIYRDLDILVIDQRFLDKVGKFEQKLLPLGSMREPFSAIERADIIILNRKFSEGGKIPDKLLKYFSGKELYRGYYQATGIYDVKTHKFYDVSEFQGQKSLVVCGIAKPYSFLSILEKNKIDIKNKLLFPDHKDYTHKEVQNIRKKFYDTNAYSVLTTHKDAVKLTNYAKELDDIDIYYLKIEMKLEDEEKFKDKLLNIAISKKN